MLSDDQLVSPERGVYELPEKKTVTAEGDVTESAGPTEDVTEPEESREGIPILGDSPSGIWHYGVLDGDAIPHEELRRCKGYLD